MDKPPLELTERSIDTHTGTLSFSFRLGADRFTETFTLTDPSIITGDPEHHATSHLLDVAHLCVGVSYYKLTLPGRIVSPHALHPTVAALAPHLYDHGLRELAVRNNLDVPLPIVLEAPTAPATDDASVSPFFGHLGGADDAKWPKNGLEVNSGPADSSRPPGPLGPLVPFGGGKDSTLTLSVLADAEANPVAFSIHPTPVQRRAAAAVGVPLIEMTRGLDPLLAVRTAEGGWNGHIPITAINSSISAIVAALSGRRDVVIANERSAEEPTQRVGGVAVNHQYSKTFAFENALAAALAPAGVRYWSSVRRYSELAIAGALVRRGTLRNAILSCNRAFSLTEPDPDPHWCRNCAKCRFTFVSFAPFLSVAQATEMFGGNLLDDPAQVDGVRALWTDKPFDCVGELAESAIALAALANKPGWRDTIVVRTLAGEAAVVAASSGTTWAALLTPNGDDNVPAEYATAIADAMHLASSVDLDTDDADPTPPPDDRDAHGR